MGNGRQLARERQRLFVEPVDEKREDGIFETLLEPYKVIRDPVHGDIWLTELEVAVVDTTPFQRLRRIRQLGPTHFVYPGAQHSRFEHSLGTLHVASRMANAIRRNAVSQARGSNGPPLSSHTIRNREMLLLRLTALLHDLAHIAFGHTLESEGRLFPATQWADAERRERLCSQLRESILDALTSAGLHENSAELLLNELADILAAEEGGEDAIAKLPHPFIADLVGNTICADLLDYVRRDSYFTGLKLAYDDRIIDSFVLEDFEGKVRAALQLERRKRQIRKDVISSCVDLLKVRYSLAERVYYHRVKVLFSAMVIKMVDSALRGAAIKPEELLDLGDDELVGRLTSLQGDASELKAAARIAQALLRRSRYRIVLHEGSEERTVFREGELSQFESSAGRWGFEELLTHAFSFRECQMSPGAFIVYYPKRYIGKEAEAKVCGRSLSPTVQVLDKLLVDAYPAFHAEVEAIKDCYRHLWHFMVLVHPEDAARLEDRMGLGVDDVKGHVATLIKEGEWSALPKLRARLMVGAGLMRSVPAAVVDEVVNKAVAVLSKREMTPATVKGRNVVEIVDVEIEQLLKRGQS